jgi:hypothetical protein
MATLKRRVKARAKEPSSYAGLSGILAALLPVLPAQYQAIAGAVGAVAGAVAIWRADPGNPER